MSIQELVSKDLDTIRQEMFDHIAEVQEEYVSKGWLPARLNLNKGIARGLIELWCWGLWQLYLFLAMVLTQAFADDTATGLWLDMHCKQVGVKRRAAAKANGIVYFTRTGNQGNVPIPKGRVIRTPPDAAGQVYRYVTTEAAVIPAGATEIAVPVVAEEYGARANATVGQISEMVTMVPGVEAVENRAGWLLSEGSDEEQDPSLRVRYELAWKDLNGVTKYAYEAWARSVVGVVQVKVRDQHPRGEGTIDVVITGTAGEPTQALIDAVDAVIHGTGIGDEKVPINDDVLVTGPTIVPVIFAAELEIFDGDPEAIKAEASSRVQALFAALSVIDRLEPFGLGGDVTLDRMKGAMMLPGVKRVNTAFVDVPVAEYGLAVLTDLDITHVIVAEA